MRRFDGKAALVTGAARGLGEAAARRFATEGARVLVVDLDGDGAEAAASSIRDDGGRASAFAADVSSAEEVAAMVGAAVDAFGSLDVLVNNAAVFGAGVNFLDIPEHEWDKTMKVNLKAPFLCTQAAVRQMRQQESGGSIVFVSSVSGVLANEHQADYNASKHGVIGLARCVALDCRNWGIRSNAVCPTGMLGTQMMDKTDPVNVAPYAAATAFARLAEVEEVVNAIAFLASEEASFITGAVLMVDGGATAWQPSGRQLQEGMAAYIKNYGDGSREAG